MANENIIIAAVVGVLALLVSGVVAAGGRARDAVPNLDSGGSSTPMYQGRPRSAYDYNGTATSLFRRWRRGEITTVQFQTRTAQGNGTASLVEPGGSSTSSPSPMPDGGPTGGAMPNQQGPGDGRAGGEDDAPNIPDAGEGSSTGLDDTFDADTSSGSFLRDEDQSVDDYRAEFTSNLLSDELINEVEG